MSSNPPSEPSGVTSSPAAPSTTPPDAPDKVAALLKNDASRTNFDPTANKWINFFKAISGQMTREGEFHYRESLYREMEEKDCARCETDRDWLLQHSPVLRFMQDKIADLNGDLGSRNIHCARCPARLTTDGQVVRTGGGFSPLSGIKICANEMRDRNHLEDTIAHEMVHAWDHLRWKMDGVFDLRHAACTEIRAAMLSGECRWSREWFLRKNFRLTRQFQSCVRKKAVMSVLNRPGCTDEAHAAKVVNEVWGSCFADTRPFDEVYN